MASSNIFKGAATALITPMTESGVDYDSLAKLYLWEERDSFERQKGFNTAKI